MDITKVANLILYMIEKKVSIINDKKVSLLLFLIDFESLKTDGSKIFNDKYIKQARNPEPKVLTNIFEIIENEDDLEEDDPNLYLIQELLDFVNIEIVKNKKFIELQFTKYEEDFDGSLFSKKEFLLIDTILEKYKETTIRSLANNCFKIDEVRQTPLGDIII